MVVIEINNKRSENVRQDRCQEKCKGRVCLLVHRLAGIWTTKKKKDP